MEDLRGAHQELLAITTQQNHILPYYENQDWALASSTSSKSGFVEEGTESIKDVTNLSINDFEGEETSLGSQDLFSAQIRDTVCRNTSMDL